MHRMRQTGVGVHANMRLHSKVPLVALLDLVHLGTTLTLPVLNRIGHRNDGGNDDGAGLEHQALLCQCGVDGGQHLGRQLMLVQQMVKAQDIGLVGYARMCAVQSCKAAVRGPFVQFFFHGPIGEVDR